MTLFAGRDKSSSSASDSPHISLLDLIFAIADQLDLTSLYQQVGKWLYSQTHASLVIIYPYSLAENQLALPTVIGAQIPDLPDHVGIGSGVHGEVAKFGKARLVEHSKAGSEPGLAPGMASAYVMPLTYHHTLYGVISIQSERDNLFVESLQEELDMAARLISIQVHLLDQLACSQQTIARFERFQELSQRLSEQLRTKDLLQSIVDAAREMLDTQMSVFLEVRDYDDQLYPVAWAGIDDETARGLKSFLNEDLKGLVASTRQPARTSNVLMEKRTARAADAVVPGTVGELAVPVIYHDTLYGTLAVETDHQRNFTDEELNLLTLLAAQAGVAMNNASLFETTQRSNRQLEQVVEQLVQAQLTVAMAHDEQIRGYETEIETARQIQESLLPQEAPDIPQLDIAVRSIPAKQVSGDYYLYPYRDEKLFVAIGDVSGKGIPAALFMAVTTTAFREQILHTPSPAPLLNELNNRLLPRMKQNQMNTGLMVAAIDLQSNTLELANAGMVQPYLFTANGWQSIDIGGYPLGAAERSNYSATTVDFPPGSLLLMVSDGVTECQNPKGELFSFDRLEAHLASLPPNISAEAIVNSILQVVYRFVQGNEAQDDLTVIAVRAL